MNENEQRHPGGGGAAGCHAESSAQECRSPDIIGQFLDAMRAAGIGGPRELIADGKLRRFQADGDRRGSLNGWCVLYPSGFGSFGSWKLGLKETWRADGDRQTLTRAERERLAADIARAQAEAEAERQDGQQATAEYARRLWRGSEPADPAHPYLVAKAVQPHGLRQRGQTLFVPLGTLDRDLWNLQRISSDGSKRFLKGGRVAGLASPIGDLEAPGRLLICEGFSTGATLYEETGSPVLCAMNAGGLRPVAMAARERWPEADIVVAADNDRFTRLPDGRRNPGVTFAREAAAAAGARLMVPEFPEGCTGTDYNDLRLASLKNGVRGVPGVLTSKSAGFSGTPRPNPGVPGVLGRMA